MVVIIHIFRARVIFLLFCDHQYTEYYEREMEIGVLDLYPSIEISKFLCDNNIHTI